MCDIILLFVLQVNYMGTKIIRQAVEREINNI